MGYRTTFTGVIEIDPPLTPEEQQWVRSPQTAKQFHSDESACRAGAWAPTPRWRRVYWPPRYPRWSYTADVGVAA